MTAQRTRHGAQITFTQTSEHRWTGQLLNERYTHDRQEAGEYVLTLGRLKRYTCVITEHIQGERRFYMLVTMGPYHGGRRYRYFNTLDEAQEAAIKWARRRFYTDEMQGAIE